MVVPHRWEYLCFGLIDDDCADTRGRLRGQVLFARRRGSTG